MADRILDFPERETEFDLLCGVLKDGNVTKECKVREMNGSLRKKVAQSEYRKEGYKTINAVLDFCVMEIGGEPFTNFQSREILMADVDFLLMKIRQHTLGDEVYLDVSCPQCGNKSKAELLISEIECFPLYDDEFEIEDVNGTPTRVFRIDTENWDAKLRYPTKQDQKIVAKTARKNMVEASYMLYSRMLLELNGQEIKAEHGHQLMKDFEAAGAGYIDEFTMAVDEKTPGVESIHYWTCECGNRVQLQIGGADFLFSTSREQKRGSLPIG